MKDKEDIKIMTLECPSCNVNFNAEILCDYEIENSDDFCENRNISFTKCINCSEPILIEQETEISYDFSKIYWGVPKVIYPNSEFHINPVIPEKLRLSLLESIKCFKSRSFTASTIMCRRTIEGFCQLKDVKEKNLALSILKLKQSGIINEQLYDWATELRLIGNEAAHNIDIEFNSTDAKDILDFTIAILDFTYSFKDKFDKFQKRMRKQS